MEHLRLLIHYVLKIPYDAKVIWFQNPSLPSPSSSAAPSAMPNNNNGNGRVREVSVVHWLTSCTKVVVATSQVMHGQQGCWVFSLEWVRQTPLFLSCTRLDPIGMKVRCSPQERNEGCSVIHTISPNEVLSLLSFSHLLNPIPNSFLSVLSIDMSFFRSHFFSSHHSHSFPLRWLNSPSSMLPSEDNSYWISSLFFSFFRSIAHLKDYLYVLREPRERRGMEGRRVTLLPFHWYITRIPEREDWWPFEYGDAREEGKGEGEGGKGPFSLLLLSSPISTS